MIQWPLRFVDPQNHPQNEGFWTLVGRQLQIDCEQTNAGSGNSGTVCTRRQDLLQVEMKRSCSRTRSRVAAEIAADSNHSGRRSKPSYYSLYWPLWKILPFSANVLRAPDGRSCKFLLYKCVESVYRILCPAEKSYSA